MAELINAKCPNCGAVLELPANLDRAFCIHCGGSVIIAKDEVHYHTQKTAIACPECKAKGYFICSTCQGNGYCKGVYVHYSLNKPITTPCQKGWCPKCKGKGSISKILYKIPCDHCNGSKICPTCRGIGRCYTCKGAGKVTCLACNGSGFKVYRGD
jgi:DnaJ-class molecular chaperone